MRVLGIDPGYAIVGYGCLDYAAGRLHVAAYDAITTEAHTDFGTRLVRIYDEMTRILDRYKPDAMSVEKLYFTNNVTTGIAVAQARGCILLAAEKAGVPVFEYTPPQIKQAVTGYGGAEKRQMIAMTTRLLGLAEPPQPDDVADALAAAICHANTAGSLLDRLNTGGNAL
ncbi:MAG: crossover junction endodeoxyribonuclease RuvC [Clostridia bacterium]|nr:crossover junction endodeoxyribonuclease RuvC [Clostridia bacterium]